MSFPGFGRSTLPFHMFKPRFNLAQSAAEARRADRLTGIYHRGQDLAWDGRQVLLELMQKHGGLHVAPDKAPALGRLFNTLMWGEMAAWKISAQLADRLVPLPARMAATSQVHDEARHFYVLHDYLQELGHVPGPINRPTRIILDSVLESSNLGEKLLGMQLLIETIALTLFQSVRESQVEPVLCDLLRYFEKDEARHVGLGLQYLPSLLSGLSRPGTLRLLAFQMWIFGWALLELKVLEPDLRTLGVDPRRVFMLGMAKQALVFESLWGEMGGRKQGAEEIADRLLLGAGELLFPLPDAQGRDPGLRHLPWRLHRRLRDAIRTFRGDIPDLPAVALDPEDRTVRPEPIRRI